MNKPQDIDHVPLFESLSEAYIDIDNSLREKHQPRYENLTNEFLKAYGEKP